MKGLEGLKPFFLEDWIVEENYPHKKEKMTTPTRIQQLMTELSDEIVSELSREPAPLPEDVREELLRLRRIFSEECIQFLDFAHKNKDNREAIDKRFEEIVSRGGRREGAIWQILERVGII